MPMHRDSVNTAQASAYRERRRRRFLYLNGLRINR
jgi:hypothetical protein